MAKDLKEMRLFVEEISQGYFLWNESEVFNQVLLDKIKIFKSNTRPLLLSFSNKETGALSSILYKKGDDM